MRNLTGETNKGKFRINYPENWDETITEQFIRIIREWDGVDPIKAFSILSGMEVHDIQTSTDNKLEAALYESVRFLYGRFELDKLPIPETLELRPLWFKDAPLVPDRVTIPKKIGRLTIGQAIQARKCLEGMEDIREGVSMVTAIYLQPLIDQKPFDMLRSIELEQIILKMPITRIYPIGVFFLQRLSVSGPRRGNVWHRILRWAQRQTGRKLRG